MIRRDIKKRMAGIDEAEDAIRRVVREISNITNGLLNENVKGNQERRLDMWCLIFSRLLLPDGKRMLCSNEEMRFNVRQRAHDALDFPGHRVEELGKRVSNFLYRVEYLGLRVEDICEEEQL